MKYQSLINLLKQKKFLSVYFFLTLVLAFVSFTVNFLLFVNYFLFQMISEFLILLSSNILFFFILLLKLNLNAEDSKGKIFTFFNRLLLFLFFIIPIFFLSEIMYSFIFVNYLDVFIARSLGYISIQILFGYGSFLSAACLVSLQFPRIWTRSKNIDN